MRFQDSSDALERMNMVLLPNQLWLILQAKAGKKEPWKEVYAGSDKLAAPAPGNTNAFSYSNDGHII